MLLGLSVFWSFGTMAVPVVSEEVLGRKWDRCLTDGLVKFGGGVLVGGVLSLLFFKRRRWPIVIGSGFGLGLAYSNCEKEINNFVISASKKK